MFADCRQITVVRRGPLEAVLLITALNQTALTKPKSFRIRGALQVFVEHHRASVGSTHKIDKYHTNIIGVDVLLTQTVFVPQVSMKL